MSHFDVYGSVPFDVYHLTSVTSVCIKVIINQRNLSSVVGYFFYKFNLKNKLLAILREFGRILGLGLGEQSSRRRIVVNSNVLPESAAEMNSRLRYFFSFTAPSSLKIELTPSISSYSPQYPESWNTVGICQESDRFCHDILYRYRFGSAWEPFDHRYQVTVTVTSRDSSNGPTISACRCSKRLLTIA